MKTRDYGRLQAELAAAYARHSPRSAALNEEAKKFMVDGGSHTLRLIQPFPPRIVSARGAWLQDEDGNDILDFWQGHFANLLGHNSEVITSALVRAFEEGWGLQTGMADRLQIETAELFCRQTGAERVRFTTSGSLTTMYAIMLARSFTGRELVLKVGGGWHGAHPWGLKGVHYGAGGYQEVEGDGVPDPVTDQVVVTTFNDTEALWEVFRTYGDRLACFIVEPFIGAGGFIPARLEYLRTARELTERAGTLLILDEIISGFRFRAGDAGSMYGIKPDLSTFGKVMGGGMPVAAVAGRAQIMDLVGRATGTRVRFSGGTYSAHPASMLAAKTVMAYLAAHEQEIYPRLAELGEKTRQTVEEAFAEEGIYARCTGYGNEALPGSSVAAIRFPYREDVPLETPEDLHNPAVCDNHLSEELLRLALLLEDVHTVHGLGALSTAHTEADVDFLGEACRKAAQRVRPYL